MGHSTTPRSAFAQVRQQMAAPRDDEARPPRRRPPTDDVGLPVNRRLPRRSRAGCRAGVGEPRCDVRTEASSRRRSRTAESVRRAALGRRPRPKRPRPRGASSLRAHRRSGPEAEAIQPVRRGRSGPVADRPRPEPGRATEPTNRPTLPLRIASPGVDRRRHRGGSPHARPRRTPDSDVALEATGQDPCVGHPRPPSRCRREANRAPRSDSRSRRSPAADDDLGKGRLSSEPRYGCHSRAAARNRPAVPTNPRDPKDRRVGDLE